MLSGMCSICTDRVVTQKYHLVFIRTIRALLPSQPGIVEVTDHMVESYVR
jgi:hypothetical protein